MARQAGWGDKGTAIKEFLKKHPGAAPVDIVRGLAARGIHVSGPYASHARNKFLTAREEAAEAQEAPPTKAPQNGRHIEVDLATDLTVADIQLAASAVKMLGGRHRLDEALKVLDTLH